VSSTEAVAIALHREKWVSDRLLEEVVVSGWMFGLRRLLMPFSSARLGGRRAEMREVIEDR